MKNVVRTFTERKRFGSRLMWAWIAMLTVSVILLAGIAVALNGMRAIYNDKIVPMMEMGLALDNINSIRQHMLIALGESDPKQKEEHLNRIKRLDTSVDAHLKYELDSINSAEEQEAVNEFQGAWNQYLETRKRMERLIRDGETKKAWALVQSDSGPQFRAARDKLLDLIAFQQQATKKEYETISHIFASARMMVIALVVAGFLMLMSAGALVIYFTVTHRLEER